eukprot:327218-Chlamydomonas_euryale.AAC.2
MTSSRAQAPECSTPPTPYHPPLPHRHPSPSCLHIHRKAPRTLTLSPNSHVPLGCLHTYSAMSSLCSIPHPQSQHRSRSKAGTGLIAPTHASACTRAPGLRQTAPFASQKAARYAHVCHARQ